MSDITLKVRNTIKFDIIKKAMQKKSAGVGVAAGESHEWNGGVEDISDVAQKLYFGSPETFTLPGGEQIKGIPERRFLTDPFREGEKGFEVLKRMVKKYLKERFADEKSLERVKMREVSVSMIEEVRSYIESGAYKADAPNSELTLLYKTGDIPLIKDGHLLAAICAVVDGKKVTG